MRGLHRLVSLACIVTVFAASAPSGAYPRPGRTQRISLAPNGAEAKYPRDSFYKGTAISANGRFVAFSSPATNLVPGDTNDLDDVFVYDRKKGKTEVVSTPATGGWAAGHLGAAHPSISADGRYVAFTSWALNMVPGDKNLVSDVFVRDRKKNETHRVSVSSLGLEATGACKESLEEEEKKRNKGLLTGSLHPYITPTGRHVAFLSCAIDLAGPGSDTNAPYPDVFVHDRRTKKTTLESVNSKEQQAPEGVEGCPSLSADGRYVTFDAIGAGMVPDDIDPFQDTFFRDRRKGKTERLSEATDGSPALLKLGGNSYDHQDCMGSVMKPVISKTGRYVAFSNGGLNLVPADTNTFSDVFLIDRKADRIERLSVGSAGQEANQASYPVAITPNARYVVFISLASDLHPRDRTFQNLPEAEPRSGLDVFVHDRDTGSTELVSVAADGSTQDVDSAISSEAFGAAISADGRFVSFITDSDKIVKDDTNEEHDVFLRDRGTPRPSVYPNVSVRGEERFATTGLLRQRDRLDDVPASLRRRDADLFGASLAFRPQHDDLFVRLDLEHLPSVRRASVGLGNAVLYGFALTAGGGRYEVRVRPIAPGLVGSAHATFELFRCGAAGCEKVADLQGGYGTAGESVVASVPLSQLGVENGATLRRLRAFTAVGTAGSEPVTILDRVRLSR